MKRSLILRGHATEWISRLSSVGPTARVSGIVVFFRASSNRIVRVAVRTLPGATSSVSNPSAGLAPVARETRVRRLAQIHYRSTCPESPSALEDTCEVVVDHVLDGGQEPRRGLVFDVIDVELVEGLITGQKKDLPVRVEIFIG